MHYGTFNEHPEQTVDAHEIDLADALTRHEVQSSQFLILKFGEGIDVPAIPGKQEYNIISTD